MRRLGSPIRTVIMTIAFLVTLTIIGAAIEQRLIRQTMKQTARPEIGSWALVVLKASGALGVFSMILIQSFKQPLRGVFHRHSIEKWLESNSRSDRDSFCKVIRFIAPIYPRDILALPIEQLSAQLASAADAALVGRRQDLLESFAGSEALARVKEYLDLSTKVPPSPPEKEETKTAQNLLEARNSLSHLIQRRIDGFQIHTGNEWRNWLRLIAITLSAGLAALGVVVFGDFATWPCTSVAFALMVGLLGGLLASVARDVVAIIEKYRH